MSDQPIGRYDPARTVGTLVLGILAITGILLLMRLVVLLLRIAGGGS